uniref:Membrane integral NOTCH2 associated receptor 1 n=1 Tax=Oryzias melastigma TaxID=30732 RepID=A0A3B3DYL6_ORYME
MDPVPEYSLFLGRILDELGSQSSSRTHQDLCGSLCARFDLVHLAKLRSLLFSMACLEPSFPAALFQDRMRRSPPEPQARKLTVAADIVSIFNLIQMDRDAKETPAAASPEPLQGGEPHLEVQGPSAALQPDRSTSCQLDPNFLLRPAGKDRVPPQSGPPSPKSSYFSMNVDGGSSTEPESLQARDGFSPSRSQRRSDVHDRRTFCPQVGAASKAAEAYHRRDLQKPPTFFNHSFELPYSNPYFEPAPGSPLQDQLRVKHESLDDLQTSTYFGPTPASQRPIGLKHSTKSGSQGAWPVKSLSLNTEEGPPDFKRPYLNSKPLRGIHRCNISTISANKHFHCQQEPAVNSPDSAKPGNGVQTKDVAVLARGAAKAFRDKSMGGASFQGGDSSFSVGTQTEQKKARDLQDRDRPNPRHPPEDSEVISDDISDIFRFLDDMSVCDSLGIVQSSRHNSTGSLSQVTLKSDGDSSPERNTIKLAKSKVDRLFHSLENSDDELKLSVCKLVVRIGEIEKKLESLSGVRGEISQVLSKLNKLDQKIQEPEPGDRQADKTSAAGSDRTPEKPRPYPHPASGPHAFHTIGHNVKAEWGRPEDGASSSLRMKALKRSVFSRRPSPPLNEENSATESKVASISGSPLDWRTPSHSLHPGDFKDREPDGQERHRKLTERDHHFDYPPSQRPPKPSKKPHLVEQVFPPHLFSSAAKAHAKANLVYTDLRLAEGRRSQPSWTMEENRRNLGEKGNPLTKVDLQVQESLNPGNLEFWMEDVYTPGFDSLLKKKEAEFRRAKACKIGALITAAACTVILVIVVPICTMRS